MAARDGERGPGRARRAGTGERAPAEARANLVGFRAIEDPGAPRPLLRAHGPSPLLHARVAYGGQCALTARGKVLEPRGKGCQ